MHILYTPRSIFAKLLLSGLMLTVAATTSVANDATPPSLISVNAQGKAKAMPDQAEMHLSFSQEAPKVDQARRTVDNQVRQILKILEDYELASGSLDSSQTNIHPQYHYHQGQQNFRGYQVTRNVRFVLSNLDQLEELIEEISKQEVTRLQHIQLGLSDPGLIRQEALDRAIQHSKQLAQHIAEQYDVNLGPVHQVRYQAQGEHTPPPMAAMRAELAADSAPSYQQKELEFSAHIEVSFTLR